MMATMRVPSGDGRAQGARAIIASLWHHYTPFHRDIRVAALMAVGVSLTELVSLAALVPLTVAVASEDHRFEAEVVGMQVDLGVAPLAGLVVAAACARSLASSIMLRHEAHLVARYESEARRSGVRAFLGADWRRQSSERAGLLQNTLTGYVNRSQQGLNAFVLGTQAIVSIVVLLAGAVAVTGPAALVALVVLAAIATLLRPVLARSHDAATNLAQIFPEFANGISELVGGAREIRVFGASDAMASRIDSTVEEVRRQRVRQLFYVAFSPVAFEVLGVVLVALALVALYAVDANDLQAYAAMALLVVRALVYGRHLQSQYQKALDAYPFIRDLSTAMADYEASSRSTDGAAVARIDRVELRGVAFSYDDTPALTNVWMHLQRGEAVGVVGPSGSGKSTLVDVLLRLWEPQSGEMLVDGRDATTIGLEDWHRHVSLVPQQPVLVDGTVEENIRFYRDLDGDSVRSAAERAGLLTEDRGLRLGLDTPVGERGAQVSGGERQRIAIARALAGRPDVLILDEPTSSLDVHSEVLIQRALEEIAPDVALLIVAHRLSTLSVCDHLLVLSAGRVAAFGPREELERSNDYVVDALRASGLT